MAEKTDENKTEDSKPPQRDYTLIIQAVSAVFITVLAPVLVAAGLKLVEAMPVSKPAAPATTTTTSESATKPVDVASSKAGEAPAKTEPVKFRKAKFQKLESRPPPQPTLPDSALQFDGDDVVEIPSLVFDPQGSYTLEGFITSPVKANKGAGLAFGMPLQSYLSFTKGADWRWVYEPRKGSAGVEIAIAGAPAREARTHLACVRNGQTHCLYVDGKLFPKTAEIPSPASGASTFQIGLQFHGVIDELQVSKVARYKADFAPTNRFEPDADTLGLYHFDEAAGDVLKDSSGHNHHGKITGATWVKADGSPIHPAPAVPRP